MYIDSFDESCSEAETDEEMPDQNPPTSSSDAEHQQSADDSIDVSTEVASSGNSTEQLSCILSDNARLEHQPSATNSNSCIDVSTSDHNPIVDSSPENVTEKRKPLSKEVFVATILHCHCLS